MKRSYPEVAKIKWDLLNVWLKDPKMPNNQLAQMYNIDNATVAKYKKEWLDIFDQWQLIVEKKVIERVEQVEKKVGIWEGVWQTITGKK